MPFIVDLKKVRLRLGLSQGELARKAGVDRETISRCENAYVVTELSCARIEQALQALAKSLNETLPSITTNSGGKNGPKPAKGKKRK